MDLEPVAQISTACGWDAQQSGLGLIVKRKTFMKNIVLIEKFLVAICEGKASVFSYFNFCKRIKWKSL